MSRSTSRYKVSIEVSAPLAMFSRPDTGASPTSYPAPTWSAAKGILESIAFFSGREALFHPTAVEICRRKGAAGGEIRFQRYATNYGGPLRKDQNVKSGTTMQVFATVVADACYRIHADIRGERAGRGRNPQHHLQDLFERRIERGQCHRTPALGLSEFTCDYWGRFREGWEVDEALTLTVPSMLSRMWDDDGDGGYVSEFAAGVAIQRGRLDYADSSH